MPTAATTSALMLTKTMVCFWCFGGDKQSCPATSQGEHFTAGRRAVARPRRLLMLGVFDANGEVNEVLPVSLPLSGGMPELVGLPILCGRCKMEDPPPVELDQTR
jgi:hypothetical protein